MVWALLFIGVPSLTLLFVLQAGSRLRAVPNLPESVVTDVESRPCLGDRLVLVQSGRFVEVQAPARAAAGDVTELVGTHVARGTVDDQGSLTLKGVCRPGTAMSGLPFQALAATYSERNPETVTGRLQVGGTEELSLALLPADEATVSAHPAGMASNELAGRTFLAVAAVIALARLLGLLFEKAGQPRVLGEIVAASPSDRRCSERPSPGSGPTSFLPR